MVAVTCTIFRLPQCELIVLPSLASPSSCLPCLRHLRLPYGARSSCVLEAAFWSVIDACAAQTGRSWAEWAADALRTKPEGIGRASWLRLAALEAALSGGASSATATTTALASTGRTPRS